MPDSFLAEVRAWRPQTAIVLGSGLGAALQQATTIAAIPFATLIPVPSPSVEGHSGRLILVAWDGTPVLIASGRLHHYEGHPWELVTRPIDGLSELGIRHLLLTNAAGGIRGDLQPGSLMAIVQHLDWTRPVIAPPATAASPYSPRLLGLLEEAAARAEVRLATGAYAAVTGPCYETPAEIRALRSAGADAVGMSTAREMERAHHLGIEGAAVSLITNRAAGLSTGPIHHREVLETAAAQSQQLAALIRAWLPLLEADQGDLRRSERPSSECK